MPGIRRTSAVQEDYLKALHRLSGGDVHAVVPTSQLAEELEVTPGSVSEMLGKLAALKLVVHYPYRGAALTRAGLDIAVEMIRHHRLIETYLVQALGYRWDEVHQEADRLEHSISELLEERMWQALGHPAFDPHGDPIPTPDGRMPATATVRLARAPAGRAIRIARIDDRDPERLRAVEALGLLPGVRAEVAEVSTWEGPVTLRAGGALVPVPLGLARAIDVELLAAGTENPPSCGGDVAEARTASPGEPTPRRGTPAVGGSHG
jgi:DtxR family Mn-dependent transcriptional regulator